MGQAFYGFQDASGGWFIIIATERCDGCGRCVESCPKGILEVAPDESDPLSEKKVVLVREGERKKLKYTCAPCHPGYGEQPPCAAACEKGAIAHSAAWRDVYKRG